MPQDIKSIFIKARTKTSFQELLNSGNVKNTLIAFILDTKEIWTLGVYFPCPYSLEEIDEKFESGLKYKGLLQTSGVNALKASSYKSGWCWKWHRDDGTFAGEPVEEGDLILCISDKSSSYQDSDFTILQENLDVHTLTEDDINYLTSDSWPAVSVDLDVNDSLPNIGDLVTVGGTVDNIGTVALTNLRISERDGKIESDYTKQSFAVNARDTTLWLQHYITEEDILAGECVLNFVVTAQNKFLEVQGDTQVSVETADLDTTLNVNIFMYDANDPICFGDTITYGLTIENAGNVTYHNIVLTCDALGFSRIINKLDAGETTDPIYFEHIVTEGNILTGSIEVTASATGDEIPDQKDPENPKTPESEDTCTTGDEDDPDGAVPPLDEPYPYLEIVVTDESGTDEYNLSDTVTLDVEVTNAGNLTLSNIELSVPDGWSLIESLRPGESAERSASYVITEVDIMEGYHRVDIDATADNESDEPVSVQPGRYDIDNIEEYKPHLMVVAETTSEAPEGGYRLYDEIEYKVTVTNDGNVTIPHFTLISEETGDEWNGDSLAPGKSIVYETSYRVIPDDEEQGHTHVEFVVTYEQPLEGEEMSESDVCEDEVYNPNL